MIKKAKKDKMSWTFNYADARKAIVPIGARNLTYIEALVFHSSDKEEVVDTYDKMVTYNSQQADQEVILWMKRLVGKLKKRDSLSLYFRFIRYN